jgi:N-acetylneuraminate synthase
MEDVQRAVGAGLTINPKLAIMQCNTNYTAKPDNFKYIQLNVLTSYQIMYPGLILGLSDHTRGHASVLGAVALGALMIEKHFTDDIGRKGPDHAFSMTPKSWSEMVERTRELENALGNGVKQVEANEQLTVVLQRRAIRARKNIQRNTKISRKHLTVLRPCPPDGIPPYHLAEIIGRQLKKDVAQGEHLKWIDLE